MNASPPLPVIAVTGLAFEARIAAGPGVTVVCGGGDAEATISALEKALASGASGVVSFGTAGGLAPQLAPGDWVVAEEILGDCERRWIAEKAWSAMLLQKLGDAAQGTIASVHIPVASASAKQELHNRTGALAVDMESEIAARLADSHNLPFVACRVIVDPANRALPPAALVATRPDGSLNLPALLASLTRQPKQVSDLLRLAKDAKAARAALLRGRRMLGPGFGFPGFSLTDFPQL